MLALAALPRIAYGQPSIPVGFDDALVANVETPTALASTPDGRLLIASQLGQVYVYTGGSLLNVPALDLSATICTYRERGLLGLTVDPDFVTNHFIYANYTFNKLGDCEAEIPAPTPVNRVSRFVLGDDNRVALDTERVLIDNLPSTLGVHGLGDVGFGKDGYLYISLGDSACDYAGNSGCFEENDAARDMHALVGKILRITRDGDIPPDNPFIGEGTVRCAATGVTTPGNTCQEIFATGFRNPWRITFDPTAAGTRFLINDVGQDTWEEINEGRAGADYGWNMREGNCATGSTTDCSPIPPAGLTNPIFSYSHAEGCSSVTGGAFVPVGAWPEEYNGIYLFSDYVCGTIFKLVPDPAGGYTRDIFVTNLGTSSATDLYFGPAEGGGVGLYYTTYAAGGEVRRIVYTGSTNRKPTAALQATPMSGPTPLNVTFDGTGSTDPDGDALAFAWDFGDGTTTQGASTAQHSYAASGTYTATLQVVDPSGASSSVSVRIDAGNTAPKPVITSPAANFQFAVGDVITLQGQASDAEDGALPASSLTWRVLLHHNTHTHGFIPPTSGDTLSFRAPGPENLEAAATSYLDLELTATDSAGLQSTVVQSLMPRTSAITFLSNPTGAQLQVDSGMVTTPTTFRSWVNFPVAVQAASQPTPDGGQLVFTSWSDSGAAAHSIVTPSTDSSYTASFTRTGPPTSTPFGGTAAALPGLIQAENFDDGGEGIAYHDDSPGSNGGVYRQTDVDIESTADDNGGFSLGWATAGEWLNYTVNVGTAGSYDVAVRVASNGPGGTLHIEANGTNITGPLNIPNTGGWQTWTTITAPAIALTAGSQVWRVVMDTNGATGAVGNFNWIRVAAPVSTGQSTPFGGTAVALPGTIQAENFDEGGEVVAYVDASPGNAGGEYRATDVDIESTVDANGGFSVGWAVAGEWLNYTVNVASAGTYDLDVRVASDGAGGTFHIEVNGANLTGPLTVPNTSGWQTWATVHASGLALNAGAQVWRVVMDTNGPSGSVGNFNWLRITAPPPVGQSTPFAGTAVALPGTIEAENFDDGAEGVAYHDASTGNAGGGYRQTDIDVEATTDTTGGFNIGWAVAGEWLKYTVNVAAAGTYDLDVRVASDGAGGTFHIEANGTSITGPLSVPSTGGWQTWMTIHFSGLPLNAGVQVLRVVMDTNGASGAVANFNWFRIATPSAPVQLTPFGGTSAAVPGTIEAENFDNGGQGVAYDDLSTGNTGAAYRPTDVDIEPTTDTNGGFDVGWAVAGEWLNYTVTVAADGTYDLDVRVASDGVGGTFHVEVNGANVTGPLTVPNTGGWQVWSTIHVPRVTLIAGSQVWRVVMDIDGATGGVGNFNWIGVAPAAPQ